MRIRTRRIRPYHKKVKPILWVKVGVQGMVSREVPDYMRHIIEHIDATSLEKEGYIPIFTPTRDQDNVTMEIL
jgi:hypothetical protein